MVSDCATGATDLWRQLVAPYVGTGETTLCVAGPTLRAGGATWTCTSSTSPTRTEEIPRREGSHLCKSNGCDFDIVRWSFLFIYYFFTSIVIIKQDIWWAVASSASHSQASCARGCRRRSAPLWRVIFERNEFSSASLTLLMAALITTMAVCRLE